VNFMAFEPQIRVRIWEAGPWWNRRPKWDIETLRDGKWCPIDRVYDDRKPDEARKTAAPITAARG